MEEVLKEQRQIAKAFEQIDFVLDTLDKAIAENANNLYPVLRPLPTEGTLLGQSKTENKPALAPYAERLTVIEYRLRGFVDKLQTTQRLLEL